jgi:DNA polymerase I-like protein with 3'-5' exonuclease and polymerase domains
MLCYLDFEYRKTCEQRRDLVAVAMRLDDGPVKTFWLHNHEENKKLITGIMRELREKGATLVSFNVCAEAGSLISLGINPIKFKWVDLQIEHKMLCNSYDRIAYGKQLIDGKVKTTKRNIRKPWDEKSSAEDNSKAQTSLVACTYKHLGIIEDLAKKNRLREMIVNSESFTKEQEQEILEYCGGDITNLSLILSNVLYLYQHILPTKKFSRQSLFEEIVYRGRAAARIAVVECTGIPVDVERVHNLAKNVPHILKECSEEINTLFPDPKIFTWNKKENRYSKIMVNIYHYIDNSPLKDTWPKTETGKYSLKDEDLSKLFNFKHDYPEDNFFAQLIRYTRLQKSLKGLSYRKPGDTSLDTNCFFDYLGSDGRVRPYLNPYGAQTSRYQPKATGFPFLLPSWVRSVVYPKAGRSIVSIDYGQQEFLIGGLLANDEDMIQAYISGDPYIYLAKKAGAIPPDGTKKTHGKERNLFKQVTLSVGYGAQKRALARTLTNTLGEEYTEQQAQNLIDLYFKIYSNYGKYLDSIYHQVNYIPFGRYVEDKCIKLPDGWYMFGDNNKPTSIRNMKIQGLGGCVLRKAVELCQEAGLSVIAPLHDALYIEIESNQPHKIDIFAQCMKDAFIFFFDNEGAKEIKLDADMWGPDHVEGEYTTPKGMKVKTQKHYIDERSVSEYNKFSKYFTA